MTIEHESVGVRAYPIDVVRRLVTALRDDTVESAPTATTEPATVFTDVDRWHRERHQFFRRRPQVIGWAGELRKPNSFITRDIDGIQVLVTKADDGQIRAFKNACTHRGAQVAQGCGEARRLTCPYHAWSFDLTGELAGLPGAWGFDNIDRATLALEPLPVAVRAGLICVGPEPDVDPGTALDGIEEHMQWCEYDNVDLVATRRFVLQCNWKIAVDVNLEVYHVAALHRATLEPMIPFNAIHDSFGVHSRWAFPLRSMSAMVGQPEHEWPPIAPISLVHVLFPGTVILETPVSSQMFRIQPGRHVGESIVDLTDVSLKPMADDAERDMRMAGFEFACKVVGEEDFPAAEQCQKGAESGLSRFVFGRHEPMVQHWHRVWNEELV